MMKVEEREECVQKRNRLIWQKLGDGDGDGDGGQVPVPRFIFSKLHKNAPISTEKGASCINKQRFAIAA